MSYSSYPNSITNENSWQLTMYCNLRMGQGTVMAFPKYKVNTTAAMSVENDCIIATLSFARGCSLGNGSYKQAYFSCVIIRAEKTKLDQAEKRHMATTGASPVCSRCQTNCSDQNDGDKEVNI